MFKILIIGKRSFIGSNLKKYLSRYYTVDILDFDYVNKKQIYFFSNYTHIINTSIHNHYINKKYIKNYDLDRKFISKFNKINFKYIFLNTRKIYLLKENISENSILKPIEPYSKNKLKTEKYLKSKIRKNLISLRISNVIGKRIFHNYRKTHNLFFDNFLTFRKRKKMKVENTFKDFLSIDQFCKILYLIIKFNITGTYNLSLSKRVFLSELIFWIDKNFYKKIEFIPSTKGSFTLSNKKLLKKIKFIPTKKQLRLFCEKLFK